MSGGADLALNSKVHARHRGTASARMRGPVKLQETAQQSLVSHWAGCQGWRAWAGAKRGQGAGTHPPRPLGEQTTRDPSLSACFFSVGRARGGTAAALRFSPLPNRSHSSRTAHSRHDRHQEDQEAAHHPKAYPPVLLTIHKLPKIHSSYNPMPRPCDVVDSMLPSEYPARLVCVCYMCKVNVRGSIPRRVATTQVFFFFFFGVRPTPRPARPAHPPLSNANRGSSCGGRLIGTQCAERPFVVAGVCVCVRVGCHFFSLFAAAVAPPTFLPPPRHSRP